MEFLCEGASAICRIIIRGAPWGGGPQLLPLTGVMDDGCRRDADRRMPLPISAGEHWTPTRHCIKVVLACCLQTAASGDLDGRVAGPTLEKAGDKTTGGPAGPGRVRASHKIGKREARNQAKRSCFLQMRGPLKGG